MHKRGSGGRLSRRQLIQASLGTAGAVGAAYLGGVTPAAAAPEAPEAASSARQRGSTAGGFAFLSAMMDAYAQGGTLRLIQSYADQQGLQSTAFTYDNALAIIAYLRGGDQARARLLGDSLLHAQQQDPAGDGRLRQAYFVDQASGGAFLRLAEAPFYFTGSAVGDLGWAAIALAQLAGRTRDPRYLQGALALGNWIVANTYDTRGPGGYTFGVDGANQPVRVKSSEHNIDVFALFSMLARLSGDRVWTERAAHARRFIEAMWNPEGGFFWTGSTDDGATINTFAIPEDVQTWAYLALLDDRYGAALDWTKTNLATTDTPQTINSRLTGNLRIQGVTFSTLALRALAPAASYDPPPSPNAVWLEGSAQLAAALIARDLPARRDQDTFDGDRATAQAQLDQIRLAQSQLGRDQTVGGRPLASGQGVVAATSVLNTGYGFSYFPNLHVGATSWFLIAALGANPYQLRG
ncbi:MAG TPA: hypothetical protein VFS21_18525 [Roseiflexaceae bacterium]|nr:hypothetical protein [Roseiflexaceae bacterium]